MNTLIVVDNDVLIAGDNNKRFMIVMNNKWKEILSEFANSNEESSIAEACIKFYRYMKVIKNLNSDRRVKCELSKIASLHIYQAYHKFNQFLKTNGTSIKMPPKMCANCGDNEIKMKKCSECLSTYYCSEDCQKHDWKFHKKNCNNPECCP